jgi:large conductance mechanosensitive channel
LRALRGLDETGRIPAGEELAVLKEFRDFVMRGNLLELATAVILGLAFNAVIQSLVGDVLMNLIAGVFGEPSFEGLSFTINEAEIRYGAFINAVINFVLVALALFLVIKAYNRTQRPRPAEEPATRECPFCASAIPVPAKRCPFCTSDVPAAA